MSRSYRPNGAALPPPTRPQLINSGSRKRVIHLSKNARVNPELTPCGLPNHLRSNALEDTPAPDSKGLSYRNAVFQALLNAPMFIDFLRLHLKRREKSGTCPIQGASVQRRCIVCAMAELSYFYWDPTSWEHPSKVVEACNHLWLLCQEIFWGKMRSNILVGPSNLEQEFYPDTFLLQLLTAMRSQLEAIPGEHQTFEQMFTVHTVCRWKCTGPNCQMPDVSSKWESSFHLNLAVQKLSPKTRTTPVLLGLQRALYMTSRAPLRRGSIIATTACEGCCRPREPHIEVVNLPEILIVVRNTEELTEADDPDIPFDREIDVKSLVGAKDNQTKYELVSGIGEYRYRRLISRSCAFARGVRTIRDDNRVKDEWFLLMDETSRLLGFEEIEKLQRPLAAGGLAGNGQKPLCPEVFLYRRKREDMRIDQIQVPTPNDFEIHMHREVASRTINEIFTQKIGRGLLKFAAKVTPADPAPQDILEVDLKVSYEFDGKHYKLDAGQGKQYKGFRLIPIDCGEPAVMMDTPYEGGAMDRAVQRWRDVLPRDLDEAQRQIDEEEEKQRAIAHHAKNGQNGIPAPNDAAQAGQQGDVDGEPMDEDSRDEPPLFNNTTKHNKDNPRNRGSRNRNQNNGRGNQKGFAGHRGGSKKSVRFDFNHQGDNSHQGNRGNRGNRENHGNYGNRGHRGHRGSYRGSYRGRGGQHGSY